MYIGSVAQRTDQPPPVPGLEEALDGIAYRGVTYHTAIVDPDPQVRIEAKLDVLLHTVIPMAAGMAQAQELMDTFGGGTLGAVAQSIAGSMMKPVEVPDGS